MMGDGNDDAVCVAFCIILLILGSLPFWMAAPEPASVIDDVESEFVFIAVHTNWGNWSLPTYNGTVSVLVDGRNETGDSIDGWFLTSYRYERGTNYTVSINGTLVATDWITLIGDFGTWKSSTWWAYIGELVEVCHVNLTGVM